jgi:hypothetical protein
MQTVAGTSGPLKSPAGIMRCSSVILPSSSAESPCQSNCQSRYPGPAHTSYERTAGFINNISVISSAFYHEDARVGTVDITGLRTTVRTSVTKWEVDEPKSVQTALNKISYRKEASSSSSYSVHANLRQFHWGRPRANRVSAFGLFELVGSRSAVVTRCSKGSCVRLLGMIHGLDGRCMT